MITFAGLRLSYAVVPLIRRSAASFSARVILPFATSRASRPSTPSIPFLTAFSLTSSRITSMPFVAATWAIPLPMTPAPITPTVLTDIDGPPMRTKLDYPLEGHPGRAGEGQGGGEREPGPIWPQTMAARGGPGSAGATRAAVRDDRRR